MTRVTYLEAIILGIVQGLTEFLPISSSGHLVLVRELLGVRTPGVTFEVLLHLGTAAAVVAAFVPELAAMVRGVARLFTEPGAPNPLPDPGRRLLVLLLISAVPTALFGIGLKPWFERAFQSPTVVGWGLLVTGTLLWLAGRRPPGRRDIIPDMTAADALLIGTFQGLAITPGISRSGATIAAGIFRGIGAEAAARYSFILSLPAILAAALLDAVEANALGQALPPGPVAAGVAAAALSGFWAIRFLLRYLKSGRLTPFAYYTWAVGLVTLALTTLAGR